MTTTTNYGYTVITGTDSPVNIQNDVAPNFTAIDGDLKDVSDAAITVATHTVAGSVHQLVRDDADRNVLYFVATGDMVAGDTFTVDGVPVTARLANGVSLTTNAFRINNTVMGILVGTVLNLQVPGAEAVASDVTYDNTGSGLTATNVQDAIDEVKNDIPSGYAASAITYNNTISGLTATDVQYAIDELKSLITPAGEVYELTEATVGNSTSCIIKKDGVTLTTLINSGVNTFSDLLITVDYSNGWRLKANVALTADGVAIPANGVIFTIGAYSGVTKTARIVAV